jgi:uncharacterized membrane protein
MFISTWLLILIVVVVISARWPTCWGEIRTLAIVVSILLALVSWLIWVITVEGIRTSLWWHEIQVRAAATPQAAEKLRRDFADAKGSARRCGDFRRT